MRRLSWLRFLTLIAWLAMALVVHAAEKRPYIGYIYPAGGQQGTTFQIEVGGQELGGLDQVFVTGSGVKAKVVEYREQLKGQEVKLLREQLGDLKKALKNPKTTPAVLEANRLLKAKIERRMDEYVKRPACASIANIAVIEVAIATDARPGERELRLGTPSGISNPMVFHVGQFPEVTRNPMKTSEKQVLGREEMALRKKQAKDSEVAITLPCTVNGQIGSSDVDQYRFKARKGQQIVISALARQLIPYIADAVPGWFQPIMELHDAEGREVSYADNFRFKPDPIIFYTVPADGEYVFSIHDSIYRGREDFVYRITVGELPYLTSIFPLGVREGEPVTLNLKGVNLGAAKLDVPAKHTNPGIYMLGGNQEKLAVNVMPFEVDTLPEVSEQEPNDTPQTAQKVTLPVIINGRVNHPDDWDMFQFTGHAGQTIVAEVIARRLDSPLDSIVKLTDASGTVLAFNDDRDDPGDGLNTHHADSYIMTKLPTDGTYYVQLGDTGRNGGEEFGYRLRISEPRPDFELRVVPSSVAIRGKSSANVSVHLIRKDGFTGPIYLTLKNPPKGIAASMVSLTGTQTVAQLTVKTDWLPARTPISFNLDVEGSAKAEGGVIARAAVPAEDRMQAFLWRHLVPTMELKVLVYNPASKLANRPLPSVPIVSSKTKTAAADTEEASAKPNKKIGGRLRELKVLFEEGYLTKDFYIAKVEEYQGGR